jgi:hypothetical protein
VETERQNCTRLFSSTKACVPNSSSVHDVAGFATTVKRQPISFSASETDLLPAKL